MPEFESVRTTAEAIGRITCIKTGEEIGLLYHWDNGETQAALYDDGHPETSNCSDHPLKRALAQTASNGRV
ncbi:hypothetical protein VWX97_08320 [Phaeobacter sp. JH18-32]|uniref:hypothetical protein n=1 Tax=Phaeobacter TaxID=302485 RepID=UPI003A87A17D